MVGIPTVYAPYATCNMISVQQLCAERNTVIMFLKDGAVGVKLNPVIINYLNKIKNIAIENNLVSITGNVNYDNSYEIENRTNYNHNIHLYKHHNNDML